MLRMQRLQPRLRDIRINLRRGKIGMPEQHLHHPQVGAVVQQVRGERMPQRMRR